MMNSAQERGWQLCVNTEPMLKGRAVNGVKCSAGEMIAFFSEFTSVVCRGVSPRSSRLVPAGLAALPCPWLLSALMRAGTSEGQCTHQNAGQTQEKL